MQYDYLIVGQGLAGSLLWWELERRGAKALVVSEVDPNAASSVAPGIINPLAGLRFNPSWRVEECLPVALSRYEQLGEVYGEQFFTPMPIVRLLKNEEQLGYLKKRLNQPNASRLIAEVFKPQSWPDSIKDEYGSFSTAQSGYLRVTNLLNSIRRQMETANLYKRVTFKPDDLDLREKHACWNGIEFQAIILCQGWRSVTGEYFKNLPWRPAKGETLHVEASLNNFPNLIFNRGQWLLPLGNNKYWTGSTYEWDDINTEITPEAELKLLEKLRSFVLTDWSVYHQQAGIRPILHDYKPVLGPHPKYNSLFIFNGLGSKGVLNGPWCATQLANHLLDGQKLPNDSLTDRFGILIG